mgnify:CR=1 FL=1
MGQIEKMLRTGQIRVDGSRVISVRYVSRDPELAARVANAVVEEYLDLQSSVKRETTDIAAVMLAKQKASVGFEATLQVRNKLLSAYENIMNMPV